MQAAHDHQTPAPALVAIASPREPDVSRYLQITPAGVAAWVEDPAAATAFASMREATRMALRLPGTLRAFGLPQRSELAAMRGLH